MESGDKCPCGCGGRLRIRDSRLSPDKSEQKQYLQCNKCGHRLGKSVRVRL